MIASSNSFQRLIDMRFKFSLLSKVLTVGSSLWGLHLPKLQPQGFNGISVSKTLNHSHYGFNFCFRHCLTASRGSNHGLCLFCRLKADTEMRFGGLISTSNKVKGEKITVESDSDLLWTISIKKPGSTSP